VVSGGDIICIMCGMGVVLFYMMVNSFGWPCLNHLCSFALIYIDRDEEDQEYCRYRNNPGYGDVSELHLALRLHT
jgi:hypothetical protein